jgi:hypothetical protein
MDLQSIAATTKAVPFCGGTVDVIGLSLRKLTQLIVKYPELMTLVGGNADIANLVTSSPEAALSIIALGTCDMTERDSKKLLKAFDDAAVGEQIDLLGSIIDLTFAGQRAGPFLASLAASGARADSLPPSAGPKIPAENSSGSLST